MTVRDSFGCPVDTRARGVIAFDAAWGGIGWSAWVPGMAGPVPLAWGHAHPKAVTWRELALLETLEAIDDELADPGQPVVWRVVIEQAPWVFGGERGNQFATGYGLGGVAGRIGQWGLRREWGWPWLVKVDLWRGWYGLRNKKPKADTPRARREKHPYADNGAGTCGICGGLDDEAIHAVVPTRKLGRGGYKQAALDEVRARGWGHLLVGLAELNADNKLEGPAVDMAEGALLGAGALVHLADAPKGPKGWTR